MMKSILRVVCVSIIAFLAAFSASSATIDVTVGDFTYSIDSSSMTAVLTGTDNPNLRDPAIPDHFLLYGYKRYTVVGIGDHAFSGCGLTGLLTIPNSVKTIGDYAFYGCSGLSGWLTIPNSVTSIGNHAFSGCGGLFGSLTIGSSVKRIGWYAFYECSGLTGR